MMRQLLVESIRVDGGTQSRARINEETVAEYAAAMKASGFAPSGATPRQAAVWPPVAAYFDGTEYWLADGFHRVLATKRVGRKHILAEIKQGTREDAAWAACGANQVHGLRRTNADKEKAVLIALRLRPQSSLRAIAEHCGVGDDLVRSVRSRCRFPAPETVVGKDGKHYPGSKQPDGKQEVGPGGRAEHTAGHGPPPDSSERGELGHVPIQPESETAEPEEPPAEPTPPPPPAKRREPAPSTGSGQVDDVGRRIPEHLLPLWERRQEVQDLLTALSRVRVALRTAQDGADALFSEIPFSAALAHLDQAYNAVQVAKPYAVCAFCQGQGCKACGKRGLLGKFRWDTCVPKEHKEAVARIVEQERGGAAA